MHPTNCLNCGSNLGPSYKFCAVCGQKAATHRLSFHEIGHDALHYVTHADKGIFHLIGQLARRPGTVAREYIDGKRAKYFKPINLFLIVGTILVFMTTRFSMVDFTRVKSIEVAAARAKDPAKQQYLYGIAKRVRNVTLFMSKYSNVANMLATPLFAFIFYLFYKKQRYSFLEHLVASMFFISFSMLCYSLLVVPWQSKLSTSKTSSIILLLYLLFDLLFRGMAYYHFICKKGFWQAMKAIGVSLLAMLIWVSCSILLVDQYIKTGFSIW
jgi:hypothetical protein